MKFSHILITSLLILLGAHKSVACVTDRAEVFTTEQIAQINRLTKQLDHDYSIFVCIITSRSQQAKKPYYSRSSNHFLNVNIDVDHMVVNTILVPGSLTYESYYQTIFYDALTKAKTEKSPIYTGVVKGLERMIREKAAQSRAEAAYYDLEEEEYAYSPKLKAYLLCCFGLVFYFVFSYTYKNIKKGNSHENVEFYGLARLDLVINILLSVLIVIAVIWYDNATFEDWELGIAYIALPFAFYPMLIISAGFVALVKDIIKTPKPGSRTEESISLGAQLLLINSKIPTEFLLEINFYQLILGRSLSLEIREPLGHRSTYKYYFLNFEDHKTFHNPSYEVLLDRSASNTKIEDYLHKVYRQIGRFKAYRKDFIARELLEAGLIQKNQWVINRFIPTHAGELMKQKIQKKIQLQYELSRKISEEGATEKWLNILNEYILLHPDHASILYGLYNDLSNQGQLHLGNHCPMSLFFNPLFEFMDFNNRLYQVYKYSFGWEKTPSSDDISI